MLTVHIVPPAEVRAYGFHNKKHHRHVIVDDSRSRSEARKLAHEASVLAKHVDVTAVVPASANNSQAPYTKVWMENAHKAVAITNGSRTVVKNRLGPLTET